MSMRNSTAVVGGLSEFKEEKSTKSLLERIEEATSVQEVQDLLKLGGTYKKAQPKTLRLWSRAAAKKMEELGSK